MHQLASFIEQHSTAVILWVGAICTFAIYSVLYKENPYYRLAEHIFIGLASGLGIYMTWSDVLKPKWWDPMVGKGQWWWAFTVAAGAMFYFMYSKRNAWISRLIMGGMMGMGTGAAFQAFANTYFPMVTASFKAVVPTVLKAHIPRTEPGLGIDLALSNLLFIIVLITVMAYFFFSIDHRSRSMRGTASLGRWFLMFAFGAMFGSTVMARMALFIGRLDYLTTEWGPIVPLWLWMAAGGLLLLAIGFFLLRPRPPKKLDEQPAEEVVPVEPVAEGGAQAS